LPWVFHWPLQNVHSKILLCVVFLLLALQCRTALSQNEHRDSVLNDLDKHDLIDFSIKLLKLDAKGKVRKKNKSGDLLFSVLPVAPAQAGEDGVAISAINVSFYLDQNANLSSIYFYPYTNFAGSYGVILSPNIWLDGNTSNINGDFRLIKNVVNDYGLGTSAPKTRLALIEFSQIRTYMAIQTRVRKYFYAGAGYFMDYFYNVGQTDQTGETRTHSSNYPYGSSGDALSSGVTANILRDNRKNSVNPRNGFYYNVIFRANDKAFGSTYSWNSLYIDSRRYYSFSVKRHKILAVRALYWGTYGNVPYLNLPATFQDLNGHAGRGYSTNRFRGKQMLFAEAEYRFDVSDRGFFGATLFVNAQSLTEPSERFETIAPAAGIGLRLKFNRRSDTNIALDFAYGRDGFGFNMSLGEYF
jgi:outer membrane protein assembly factor BamA